jgi:hypothetical protein
MATGDEWPYPVTWCPVCKQGFRDREQEIIHRLEKRHWQPTPAAAVCAEAVARVPAPDPAQAQQLKEALDAAAARRSSAVTAEGGEDG